tara:strand:- start:366 stop:611 length:246 start_codon:yes stop_codon:yes gene_type:complete
MFVQQRVGILVGVVCAHGEQVPRYYDARSGYDTPVHYFMFQIVNFGGSAVKVIDTGSSIWVQPEKSFGIDHQMREWKRALK